MANRVMMPTKFTECLLIALAGAAFMTLPGEGAMYDDAVKEYAARHYPKALSLFNHAAAANPSAPMVHYYLANVLVHMDQHQDAIEEYRLCLSLDPTGPVSDYCLRALKGYHSKPPDAAEMKILRDTVGGGAHPAVQTAAAVPPGSDAAAPAVASGEPAGRSISKIRRQLASEKKKNDFVAEASASDVLATAQKTVQTIRDNAELAVARLYAVPRYGPGARSMIAQEEMQAKEQQIRQQAKAEEECVLRQAHVKADECRLAGEMRGSALDQVAENLEHQLADDGKYSGVRLVPEGTNLYVRSYASAPTVRALPEVHAAVARIYAQHSGDDAAGADSAVADKSQPVEASRSVRGKIVKPLN